MVPGVRPPPQRGTPEGSGIAGGPGLAGQAATGPVRGRRPWPPPAAVLALVVLLAGAGLGGCGTGPAPAADTAGVGPSAGDDGPAETALAAAVAVEAAGCRQAEELTGSGSVVGDELVVTVAHVVAGSTSVSVTDAAGTERRAVVVGLDTVNDLALLAVAGLPVTPLPLGPLGAGGHSVFVVHDAEGRAAIQPAAVVRRADLSMADLYGQGSHVRPGFELDATVEPGDSGAVVVGDDGTAGAVVFATSRETAGAGLEPETSGDTPQRAWATDIAALAPLLAGALDAPVPTGRCVE